MSAVVAAGRLRLEGLTVERLRGRRVAVLGFARSGLALARFLADAGARVTIYDRRPREELEGQIAGLAGRPAELRLGPGVDPAAVLAGHDLIATSPSVSSRYPTTEPRLRAALARIESEEVVPVLSEVDLFLRLCPATTVGVTGTKGKSTTASLAATVLEMGDRRVWLGGNIGTPLIARVVDMAPRERVVVELSELQLPTLSRGTDLAVYTNVTVDHLDRHGSPATYREVKARLARLTTESGGLLVLNDDDAFVRTLGEGALRAPSRTGEGSRGWPGQPLCRYTLGTPPAGGVGIDDGWISADGIGRLMAAAEVPLPGEHNLRNVLAAIATGLHFGVPGEAIRAAVRTFPGVEHRLETVAVIGGVRFVNDSQGTQPDAVVAALRAFDPPLVLIAGGREKGLDLGPLADEVARRAYAAVLIGESAQHFERLFRAAGLGRVERAADMKAAVERSDALAREALAAGGREPATVLLSPAAASFDMFEDYAARGEAFRASVARLARGKPLASGERPG